ncbi:MAG TPA: rhodanese-like domain-containing protein [Egicoccus sp.]|nr:rhodanese-like domain-containing protein [Egicoccus sp.]HSK22940.1 rhodanese-like domain-containing protein [Egicoccus sp.]
MVDGPLVSCEWLRDHLDDPAVVVAEIAQEADQAGYAEGHVPGAQGWYWKDVAWDTYEREFPMPELLAQRLGERGVGDDDHLVLYGIRNQFATYCYWVMTEMCGFSNVHVLDGGKVRWQHLGLPLTTDVPAAQPTRRTVRRPDRRDRSRVRRDELLAALRDGSAPRLLDARYEEEYDGRRVKPGTGFDHGAERHGHIPGAVNLPYERFLTDDGSFRSPDELRALFEQVDAAPDQTDDLVAYCRLGHRGSLVWFVATQVLGYDHVRVYDGSWTEWGSMVGVPVER